MAMSGPRVAKFTMGWAIPLGKWTAHYFTRDEAGTARSACGMLEGPAGKLFHPGSLKRCKRCAALIPPRP